MYLTSVTNGTTLSPFVDDGTGRRTSARRLRSATVFVHQTTATADRLERGRERDPERARGLGGIGTGNVVVTQERRRLRDPVPGHAERRQHLLPLTADPSALTKTTENLGGGTTTTALPGTASWRRSRRARPASATPATNQVQLLTVDATSGTYVLSFHVGSIALHDAPIAYNASADQLRQAIQNAIAVGETTDPNIAALPRRQARRDGRPLPERATRTAPSTTTSTSSTSRASCARPTAAPASTRVARRHELAHRRRRTISTRMDGIDYYGFEQVNIATGAGSEVFNVQGTTQGQQRLRRRHRAARRSDERHAQRRRRPRLPVVEREPRPDLVERLRLPDRQPRRLPGRAEHRSRRRPRTACS